MVASMTAFARQQQEFDWGTLSWEVRSVNHRYLEPGMRIPELFRAIEPNVRETLRKSVARGKVECTLRFQIQEGGQGDMQLNEDLVRQLRGLASLVADTHINASPLSVAEILRWPGVLQEHQLDMDAAQADAMALFKETLEAFQRARQREGDELANLIRQRLAGIRDIVAQVRNAMPDILKRQQANIRDRLDSLKSEIDPARIEQELVLLAQKSDVDEELDRLDTHVSEVERVLNSKQPIGRRLDFLMQELNREANTLSSKSVVAETTLNAVELKVLIEQMREQVQNIE